MSFRKLYNPIGPQFSCSDLIHWVFPTLAHHSSTWELRFSLDTYKHHNGPVSRLSRAQLPAALLYSFQPLPCTQAQTTAFLPSAPPQSFP